MEVNYKYLKFKSPMCKQAHRVSFAHSHTHGKLMVEILIQTLSHCKMILSTIQVESSILIAKVVWSLLDNHPN